MENYNSQKRSSNTRKIQKFIEIENSFKKTHLILLTTIDEYEGNKSPLRFLCPFHTEEEQTVLWNSFNRNNDKMTICKHCKYEKLGNTTRTSLADVRKEYEEKGCVLLEDNYKNNKTKMPYICLKFPEKIQYASLNNFRRMICCAECDNQRIGDRNRIDYPEVQKEFTSRNFTLVTDHYVNGDQILEYFCNKHNEEHQYISLYNLKKTIGCQYCFEERMSGKNNPNYKGTTQLRQYLRRCIIPWQKDSKLQCNNKCVLTGGRYDVIHHLYSFNQIVMETLKELNLPLYEEMDKYTEEEIRLMQDKCLEIHYRYPLGVCLREDVHREFHSMYGIKQNTPEQFYEFQQMKLQQLEQSKLQQAT